MFVGNLMWIFVLLLVCFFIATEAVRHFKMKYPDERTYKYIPAIAAIIIFVYSVLCLYFSVNVIIGNILFMFLTVLTAAMSFLICIFSLAAAGIADYRSFRKQAEKGEEQ